MEIQIDKEKETPLLSRKRVTAWVYYEGSTPSRNETLKEFAKKIKVKPENIVIKHMYTRFGQSHLKLIANVYKDTETLKRLESANLIEKHKQSWEEKQEQEKIKEESTGEKKQEEEKQEQEEVKEASAAENKQEEEKANNEQEEIKEESAGEEKQGQEENENKPKEQKESESEQEQKEETNGETKEE